MLAALALASAVTPMAAAAVDRPVVVVDGSLGPAFLTRSRSHAIGHMFKPAARLGARLGWGGRLELGGAVIGMLAASEHYRLLGAVGHARYAVWQRPRFSLGAAAALGAGYDADILHADLRADGRLAPYGFLAFDGRWALGERWLVGLEAGWQNLSVLHLGAVVGVRFLRGEKP